MHGNGASEVFSPVIKKTIEDIGSTFPIVKSLQKPEPNQSTIPKISPTTITPRINPCVCFNMNVWRHQIIHNFDFTGNSELSQSYSDADISNEQKGVVDRFTRLLRNQMMPGDQFVSGNLTHTMTMPGIDPYNKIPAPLTIGNAVTLGGITMYVGNASVSFDPITSRRVDGPWKNGYTTRNVIGAGNTVFQNFQSQTLLMRNILRARFGVNISGQTFDGNPNPRYRFSGVYRTPGIITSVLTCFCGY